jgi:hypothetical protein
MNRPIDLNPRQFNRHDRALEARFLKEQLRKNEPTLAEEQPQRLTTEFAHITDATNFLLALLACPPELRSFIDALVGISGYRAGTPDWFKASDAEISQRVGRCETWVQQQRKKLLAWQSQYNFVLVDIEDNQYKAGEKIPHQYRVHIARVAAETLLDARQSTNWQKRKFNEAMEDSAKTMLASLPEFFIHKKHRSSKVADAETMMEREMKYALTKLKKAQQTNESTGNHVQLNPSMIETLDQIKIVVGALENPALRSRR